MKKGLLPHAVTAPFLNEFSIYYRVIICDLYRKIFILKHIVCGLYQSETREAAEPVRHGREGRCE